MPRLACCCLCVLAACAADLPESGPSRGGLALRLVVDDPDGGEGTWNLRVDLINRGDEPVELVARSVHDDEEFDEWLRRAIAFEVVPEVRYEGYQVSAPGREQPQATAHLAPGETLTLAWEVDRPHFARYGSSLTLRRPGRHLIRARVLLSTVEGGDHSLHSNEQPFQVGPDPVAPAASLARVLHGRNPEGTVALDRGSADGIAIGDVFAVRRSPDGAWRLRVREVEPHRAVADVVQVARNRGPVRELGAVPPADAEAVFVAAGDDAE